MDFDVTCACHRNDKDNATITGTVSFSDEALQSVGVTFEAPEDVRRFEEALSLCLMDLIGVLPRFHSQEPMSVSRLPDTINLFYRMLGTPEGIAEARAAVESIEQKVGRDVEHDELVQVAKTMLGSDNPKAVQAESGIILIQEN